MAASCEDDDQERTRPVAAARERPFVHVVPAEDLALTRTLPKKDVKFGGVVCKAGHEVWYDERERVRVCTLARAATVFGIPIARDAYTHFHQDGRPYQTELARAKALRTAGGVEIPCAAALAVLSPSGTLELCKLTRSVTVSGVVCRAGETIAFHAGGELAAAVVHQPLEIAGTTFPAGTRLHLFPSGRLRGGWLAEPLSVAGYAVRWQFWMHEESGLRAFDLAEPATIQGHAFPARAKIELRADGSLRRAEMEVDHGFMPHGEPWTDTKHIWYDCAGNVLREAVEHWQADSPPPRFRKR